MKLNSHKKRIETKFVILILILSVSILIGMLSLLIDDNRNLSFIEKSIKDIGVSMERVVYAPIRFITSKIDHYNEMKKVYDKYKKQYELDDKSELLEEENKELKRSIAELKDALNLKTILTDYDKLNVTVINRNVGVWYNTLTIDKGSSSGIKKDMIVISNKGLIGRVIKTTFFSSDVKLITTSDLNNRISVGVETDNGMTYGLLSGYDIGSRELSVTDIIDGTSIKAGDKVVTSGLSNIYPKGIIVGVVTKMGSDEFGISKTIRVSPMVDFNDLRYITVLKRRE